MLSKSIDGIHKICNICKVEKLLEEFPVDNTRPDKRYPNCFECCRKPKQVVRNLIEKVCSKCKKLKTIDNFGINNHTGDGYSHQCKDCMYHPTIVEIKERKCNRCGVIRLIDDFWKDSTDINGHTRTCKHCLIKPKKVVIEGKEKKCIKCGEVKPIGEFYEKTKSKDIKHYTICKTCWAICCKNRSDDYKKINTKEHVMGMDKDIPNKVCVRCNEEKNKSEFRLDISAYDGHDQYCNDCAKEVGKKNFHAHKELTDEEYMEWRDKQNEERKNENNRVKTEVFKHYSKDGIIQCLDPYHIHAGAIITDLDALTLDHINSDGYKEPKSSSGSRGGIKFYRKLKQDGYVRTDLQVLCGACQQKKRVVNKEYFNGIRKYDKERKRISR